LGQRDRLEVEFSGLQFLWENGVRCIPKPIGADRDYRCAIYEYIDGEKVISQEITDSDIDYVVAFLTRLKKLTMARGSKCLPPASEACFSVRDIVKTIDLRLNRLLSSQNIEAQYIELHEFLKTELLPSFVGITKWCKSYLKKSKMSFISKLAFKERTLSPSDFGFHNTIRRNNDQIVFIDFEYFGWDDPAKMISDFLLHPAMVLQNNLKQRFIINIINHFEDSNHLKRRIEIIYPLLGLNWCLILLNEFIPEHFLRRHFASKNTINKSELLKNQLIKSRHLFRTVVINYEHFPYGE
jgi:thiamine kinase-like enzyme